MSVQLGTGDTKGTTYLGIAYGDGQWVVVGNTQDVAYSTDAINWTIPTDPALKMPIVGRYTGIAYGNGTFVAISSGTIAPKIVYTTKNPDGTYKWNESTQSSLNLGSLIFIDGLFVCFSNKQSITYSVDGINWSTITSTAKYSGILPAITTMSVLNNRYHVRATFSLSASSYVYRSQEIIRIGNTLSFGALGSSNYYVGPLYSSVDRVATLAEYTIYTSIDNSTFTVTAKPVSNNIYLYMKQNSAAIMADDAFVVFPVTSGYGALNKVVYLEPGSNQQKILTLPISGTWIYCAYDGISKVVALSTDGKTVIFDIIK